MGIGNIFSGISDFIGIFRRSDDRGDRYLSSYQASTTATSRQEKPKLKKNSSAISSKKQYTPPVKKEQSLQPLWQKPENYDKNACQLIVNCLKQVKLDRAESSV
ncbi:hypothetical protein [Nostoc sp.]|uniref:hypothetical protein n=1 Tax=Nostoc sp. TaxID=1180 RepID=UPI002FF6597A